MNAVAMTDHANMMGAFHFVSAVQGHNKGVESVEKKLKKMVKNFMKNL